MTDGWTDRHSDQGAHFSIPADYPSGELAAWWLQMTHDDIKATLPKVVEYSAHDLELTGDLFAFLAADAQAAVVPAEMACWFYLASKVMRAIGALKDGVEPSLDTIRDIRVYTAMVSRIRERGAWPAMVKP